jgi:hypothetical protein
MLFLLIGDYICACNYKMQSVFVTCDECSNSGVINKQQANVHAAALDTCTRYCTLAKCMIQ